MDIYKSDGCSSKNRNKKYSKGDIFMDVSITIDDFGGDLIDLKILQNWSWGNKIFLSSKQGAIFCSKLVIEIAEESHDFRASNFLLSQIKLHNKIENQCKIVILHVLWSFVKPINLFE